MIYLVHLHQIFVLLPCGIALVPPLRLTSLPSSVRGYCHAAEGTGIVLQAPLCLRKIPANSHGMLHLRLNQLKLSNLFVAVLLESEKVLLMSLLLQAEWEVRTLPWSLSPMQLASLLPMPLEEDGCYLGQYLSAKREPFFCLSLHNFTSPCYCFLFHIWAWKRCKN